MMPFVQKLTTRFSLSTWCWPNDVERQPVKRTQLLEEIDAFSCGGTGGGTGRAVSAFHLRFLGG